MIIYLLFSPLFKGENKKVIVDFPLPHYPEDYKLIESLANIDNNYDESTKWKVGRVIR